MKTSLLILVSILFLVAPVHSSPLELRKVDKATVRIVGVGGAFATAVASKKTGQSRVVAIPRAGHGSGIMISSDGLVLTARHVIEATDAIAVLLPGSDRAHPAQVIYSDIERDLAVLQVEGRHENYYPLPSSVPSIRLGDRVSTSGYPLDVSQKYPAAAAGEVSRMTNSGHLQLSISVNPGNSGGPVISDSGDLLGILVARGDPKAGVEGVAIVEPLEGVRLAAERARGAADSVSWSDEAAMAEKAHVVTRFVEAEDDKSPNYERTSPESLTEIATATSTPEEELITAAYAWNMHIALLEARGAQTIAQLDEPYRGKARTLADLAGKLAARAMERAPYAAHLYPIGRSIANTYRRTTGAPPAVAPAQAAAAEGAQAQAAPASTDGGISTYQEPSTGRRGHAKYSVAALYSLPQGDFAEGLGTGPGLMVRRGLGVIGLRAMALTWSQEVSDTESYRYGLLHAGVDVRLGIKSIWVGGGIGSDLTLVDSEVPVDSAAFGFGASLDAGTALEISDSVSLEASLSYHPGFTKLFNDEDLEAPTVQYLSLSLGLGFD